MSKQRTAVSPVLLAIVAEGFLTRLSFGAVSFALPLYARSLGWDLSEIGLLISLNVAIGALLMPVMGSVADRFGLKRSYIIALGLHSLTALLLAFAVLPWQIYATRLTGGLSRALRKPTANALIAEHGGKRSIASAFAWYATARSAAAAMGKALAGVLITVTAANYLWVFGFAFVASLLPILAIALYVPGSMRRSRAAPAPTEAKPSDVAEQGDSDRRGLAPVMLFGFLVRNSGEMLRGLLPLLAVEYAGLSAAETGLLYVVGTVVVVASGPAFGWLSDNVSHKLVLMVRGVANVLASAVYLISPTLAGFVIGMAIDTAGKAAFRPAWGALMAKHSAGVPHRRARSMGWMGASEEAGAVAGPILAGLLWSYWGVAALLGTRIGLALLTEIYALVWLRVGARPDRAEAASSGSSVPSVQPGNGR